MPSVCSTAACAARHDQIADAVLSRAQSTSLPRVGQYGSFPQIGSARLGAGHHQAVETAVPQFGNIAVSRRGFLQAAIAARNVRQRVEPQPHDDIVGRRRMSSTNWRSVASSAASGMLLTSPISMQLWLRNWTAAVSAGVVSRRSGISLALPYSAAMSGDARRVCAAASA